MSWSDNEALDTCTHYRHKFKASPVDLPRVLEAWIKIDINDEGHPGISVGCFVNGKCVGKLQGRFATVPSKLGCFELSEVTFRDCVSRGFEIIV